MAVYRLSTPVFRRWLAGCGYVAMLALMLTGLPLLADTGPPIYVADSGTDQGDCASREQPCATIAYALRVAGKNTLIRVAPGQYELSDPDDLIYLLSGAVTVSGGYTVDGTAGLSGGGRSMLTDVPVEYRDLLLERGFHVIVDQKGVDIAEATRARDLLRGYQAAQVSAAASPCVNGNAAGFACSNIDLLSHVARQDISALPSSALDIWGFVDLNTHREYAIMGVSVGTAVFDVTDPENPFEIGFVDGQNANWRDIKVYQVFDDARNRWQAYAYVTTDGAGDGLFVIDLGGLPHSISRVPYNSDFTNAHNVYLSNVDFGTGLALPGSPPQLIAAGAGINAGQFRSYSLGNPGSPAFQQRVASAGYMHDAASLRITDQRVSQCAVAGSPCEVLVDFNEDLIDLWDITDAANSTLLSRTGYSNARYVHSGWWSEDRQYLYAHDELDETRDGLPTTLRIFSLADLANPSLAGTWTGPTAAIDHNGFVRGNRYYMSNYTRGLTILDLSNPTNPSQVGFFDTFAANNNAAFAGAWGAYPFFHSGTVAVSDINSGMYLLRDQTRNTPGGQLAFAASSFAAAEGQQAALTVSRSGGTSGPASVDYEVVHATTDAGDLQTVSGTLNWADGDGADRPILIDAVADAESEGLEQAIVRLVNPGGATLGDRNVSSLYVSEASAGSELGLLDIAFSLPERGTGTAIVVLQRRGNAAGAASVDFSVTDNSAQSGVDYQGPASGTLNWADGDADPKTIEFDIVDDSVAETDESFVVNFANAQGASLPGATAAVVTIQDGLGANTAPNAIAGANQVRTEGSNVTLNGSLSNDPDGDTLSFQWTQVGSGPSVTLQNASTSSATFTAPAVSSDTLLQFELTVTDPGGLNASANTSVTVTNTATVPPGIGGRGGGGAPTGWLLVALAGLVARSRISRRGCA